jgi:hypothetical protein
MSNAPCGAEYTLVDERNNKPYTIHMQASSGKKTFPTLFMLEKVRHYHKTPQNFRDITLELLP